MKFDTNTMKYIEYNDELQEKIINQIIKLDIDKWELDITDKTHPIFIYRNENNTNKYIAIKYYYTTKVDAYEYPYFYYKTLLGLFFIDNTYNINFYTHTNLSTKYIDTELIQYYYKLEDKYKDSLIYKIIKEHRLYDVLNTYFK